VQASSTDRIGLVVGAGLQARRVDVTTNISDGPFYAVALQRAMKASSLSWATFDIVMFSNPSEPADSIVTRGWTNSTNGLEPSTR
jgi:hypothetical protein